jgi:hypothetical protein
MQHSPYMTNTSSNEIVGPAGAVLADVSAGHRRLDWIRKARWRRRGRRLPMNMLGVPQHLTAVDTDFKIGPDRTPASIVHAYRATSPTEVPRYGENDTPDNNGRVIHSDEQTPAWAAGDFGHIVHNRPLGVLRPNTIHDIGP